MNISGAHSFMSFTVNILSSFQLSSFSVSGDPDMSTDTLADS